MPQLMFHTTGFDLVKANIDCLLGEDISMLPQKKPKSFFAQVIIHSDQTGVFKSINIPDFLENNIVESVLYYRSGGLINKYQNSRDVVGVFILKIDKIVELEKLITNFGFSPNWIKIDEIR